MKRILIAAGLFVWAAAGAMPDLPKLEAALAADPDKIPAAGSITQVILANTALSHFTKSIEIKPSWIALYTRGNSYLYWPKIFNRAHLGVADLEQAMKIQKSEKLHSYHARAYVSLGDGYWKMDDIAKAKAVWQEGQKLFPANAQLK